MRISIHSEIVYQQEYLRRIRESLALVKLLLNKYLLNITGMEGETIRLHAHLRRIRESLASLEEIGGKLRIRVSSGEIY